MTEFTFIVVAHRDVDAVLVLDLLLTLYEGLVLEIEPVLQQTLLQELADVVKCHMDKDGSDDSGHHVQPSVQSDGVDANIYLMVEEPDR